MITKKRGTEENSSTKLRSARERGERRSGTGRDIAFKKAEGGIVKGLGGVGEGVLVGLCQS